MDKPGWGIYTKEIEGLPDATTAWGARSIVNTGSRSKPFMEILNDRHGMRGERKDELFKELNSGLILKIQDGFRELFNAGKIRGDKAEEHVVYEDDRIKAVGSTNASFGYFYLSVWYKEASCQSTSKQAKASSIG